MTNMTDSSPNQNKAFGYIAIITLIVALTLFPLYFNKEADFEGADGKARDFITEIQPKYEPWFEPLWEPPSGEIESLIFGLQAAIGAGVIGYGLCYLQCRKENG